MASALGPDAFGVPPADSSGRAHRRRLAGIPSPATGNARCALVAFADQRAAARPALGQLQLTFFLLVLTGVAL